GHLHRKGVDAKAHPLQNHHDVDAGTGPRGSEQRLHRTGAAVLSPGLRLGIHHHPVSGGRIRLKGHVSLPNDVHFHHPITPPRDPKAMIKPASIAAAARSKTITKAAAAGILSNSLRHSLVPAARPPGTNQLSSQRTKVIPRRMP